MTGLLLGLLLLAVLAVLALQVMQWLRPAPPAELPPEWLARLTQLEQTLHAMQLAQARSEGALDGLARQVQASGQSSLQGVQALSGRSSRSWS